MKNIIRIIAQRGIRSALIELDWKTNPNSFVNDIIKNDIRKKRGVKSVEEHNVYPQPYDYFIWPKSHIAHSAEQSKTFVWFVPEWSNVWGGGHFTLFRFANHFSKKGYKNIIYIHNNSRGFSADYFKKELDEAIPNNTLQVLVNPEAVPECSAAFATTWQSAYAVKSFPGADNKFYFMQDYEPHFYAYGTQSLQAKNTYEFGFHGICGGGYLKKMYKNHGGNADNYIFSTDRDIFFPKGNEVNEKVSEIFFYARPSTERRCYELGVEALKIIASKHPNITINIAGLDLLTDFSFKATLHGNLTLRATGELYRKCDVGIAFSGTNLSYLPVELMACGCPVITNRGEQVDWYCNENNAMMVDPTPNSIVRGLEALINSKSLRQKLSDQGIKTTMERTWESEMDYIFMYVTSILNNNEWHPRNNS